MPSEKCKWAGSATVMARRKGYEITTGMCDICKHYWENNRHKKKKSL
jgi:hypothetical protein